MAIIAVGFNASYPVWFAVAQREPEAALVISRGIKTLDDRFANPAYVLLLLLGLAMVFTTGIPLTTFWVAGDLYLLKARSPTEDGGVHAQQLVVESAVRLGAQVISPQHTSPVGVAALNAALQARLNPPAPGKPEVQVSAETTFRLGDRVIVGKNNYQTDCFNGETAQIADIGPRQLTLRMDDVVGERLVEYARDDWSQLQLAYTITSHRARASEWPNVVVVVSQSHYLMLQRNLVYTALTRARQRAVLIVSGGLEHKPSG